ncbi:MAG: hypothetical protein AABO58_13325 [Acidobacteriota bacterium]
MRTLHAISACILTAISTHAGQITLSGESRLVTERPLAYSNAQRLIRLADGSHLVLVNRPAPKEPIAIDGDFISTKGASYDASLRVAHWIPDMLADGTVGQIYSAAMSDDHQLLAVSGGWMGRDGRGHNGVFLLRREAQADFDYWRLTSWFDVRGMTISEIEFGPGDTLITTSHEEQPDDGAAPLITVFSFSGQKLGSFINGTARSPSSSRLTRIVKTRPSSYAVYDPDNALLRHVTVELVEKRVEVRQTGTVPISFPQAKSYLLAFDVLRDGRVAVARTVVQQDRRGQTLVSLLTSEGKVIEEWRSPRVWRYAYVENHVFRGCYPALDDSSMIVSSVAVK